MKKLFYVVMLLAMLGLLVPGCDKAPNPVQAPLSDQSSVVSLAKASTYTDNFSIPFDILVFVDCALGGAGEWIQVSGPLHILYHETINGNNFHIKMHFQPQGVSGVGLTTGDKYQGTGVTQWVENGSFVNGQYTFTFVDNFRMIGQGPDNNYTYHNTYLITLNANGTVTAYLDNIKIECK